MAMGYSIFQRVLLSLCALPLFLRSTSCRRITFPMSSNVVAIPRGGEGGGGGGGDVERRWNALMRYCKGGWSGSIGWYDSAPSGGRELVPRGDNRKLNMRMRFATREDDPGTSDWVVYHAKGQGVREEVVIEKYPNNEDFSSIPSQTFYAFGDGVIGRSGSDFEALPVIEHGFWDDEECGGMRRTVVLAYSKENLSKVCFLQQRRVSGDGSEFDPSAPDLGDIPVLPEEPECILEELRTLWKSDVAERVEILNPDIADYYQGPTRGAGALARLLGDGPPKEGKITDPKEGAEETLRIALPNGVVLACPWCLRGRKKFKIAMGYKRGCGQVQVVEFVFEDSQLINIQASYFRMP